MFVFVSFQSHYYRTRGFFAMNENFSGFRLAREEHNASLISGKMQYPPSAPHITMCIYAKMSSLLCKDSDLFNTSKEINRIFYCLT